MPWVRRNADGRIDAVFAEPVEDGLEPLEPGDPALADILAPTGDDARLRREFVDSDLALARVLEDLIDLLIERGVIRFTDLPEPAQRKLLQRRGLRREFAYLDTLFGAGDDGDDFGHGGGFL